MLKKITSALLACFLLTGASYAQDLSARVAQAINDLKAVNGGTQYNSLTPAQKKQAIALMLSTDENGNTNTNLAGKIQTALANLRIGPSGDFKPGDVAEAIRTEAMRLDAEVGDSSLAGFVDPEDNGDTPPPSSGDNGGTPPPSSGDNGGTPPSNNGNRNQGGANGPGNTQGTGAGPGNRGGTGAGPGSDGSPPPPSSGPSSPPPASFGDGGTLGGGGGDLTGSLGQDQVNQTVRSNPTIAEVIVEEVGGSASLN